MDFRLMIARETPQPWGTPGRLISTENFSCRTLELPWANNQRGISCIKSATYVAHLWYSPTFKRKVIRLEDRFGRKDCLIHNGNFAGDVGVDIDGDGEIGDLITHVRGCTLTGDGYGLVVRKDGDRQMGITNSIPTLTNLINHVEQHVGDNSFVVTYAWNCESPEMP